MEPTVFVLLTLFGLLFGALACKFIRNLTSFFYANSAMRASRVQRHMLLLREYPCVLLTVCPKFFTDYLYSKTLEMQAAGKFKMNKKQKRKDKSPGTIFD